jgi:hypothetical protein
MRRSSTRSRHDEIFRQEQAIIPVCREFSNDVGVEGKTVSLSKVNRVAESFFVDREVPVLVGTGEELFFVDREVLVGTGDRQDKRRDCGRARAVLFEGQTRKLTSRKSVRPNLA